MFGNVWVKADAFIWDPTIAAVKLLELMLIVPKYRTILELHLAMLIRKVAQKACRGNWLKKMVPNKYSLRLREHKLCATFVRKFGVKYIKNNQSVMIWGLDVGPKCNPDSSKVILKHFKEIKTNNVANN